VQCAVAVIPFCIQRQSADHKHHYRQTGTYQRAALNVLVDVFTAHLRPAQAPVAPHSAIYASTQTSELCLKCTVCSQFACFVLSGDQPLIQLLGRTSPSWQSLSDQTSSQLLLRLVMLIEQRAALAEVLPWLWPLADEDSGCGVDATPSLRMRLLAALIAVPEATNSALGGKVSSFASTH